MDNSNFSHQSINSTNNNKVFILSSKKEEPSFLSSLWDKFTSKIKQNDEVEVKLIGPQDTIRKQLCKCPKTKHKDYCDNIHSIIQMTKINQIHEKSKELYNNLLKVNDQSLDITGDNLRQIQKDITRTFPSNIVFIHKDKILKKLENVLKAFSAYDNKIKYCQGMNFIVAFLLYHCEEYVAFWLFVSLIEEYDLRSTYSENFPGLKQHVKRIEKILENEYPKYWEDFQKIGVKIEIIMVNWLLSLFSSLIPLELQMDFYKGFFSEGWMFFYQMCISAIINLKGDFYEVDEVYIALKNDEYKNDEENLNSWKNIIKVAYNIQIKTDVMNI